MAIETPYPSDRLVTTGPFGRISDTAIARSERYLDGQPGVLLGTLSYFCVVRNP